MRALQVLAGHGLVNHDREVVLDTRERGELVVGLLVARAGKQRVEVELEGDDGQVDIHGLARVRMDLADPTEHRVRRRGPSAPRPGCRKA